MNWELTIGITALVLALVAIVLLVRVQVSQKRMSLELRHLRGRGTGVEAPVQGGSDGSEALSGPAVVVYNPTKISDLPALQEQVRSVALAASLPDPVWVETSADDSGYGQTLQALAEHRPSVVIAAGGDGTVRLVAQALVGTGVPLGLLPVGTGNLLARNLNLPLDSFKEMILVALTGKPRALDFAWIEVPEGEMDPSHEQADFAKPGKYGFLVIGGMGFDADIMGSTRSDLKERIGWWAYIRAAVPNLFAKKMDVEITPGNADEAVLTKARSVMFLNCGELPGGIVLERHADPSDSWLELAVLDTNGGLIGWADLAQKVALQSSGIQLKTPRLEGLNGDLETHRVRTCVVRSNSYHLVQVDGDVLGLAKEINASIDAGALQVRVRH